jgi:hypothetical protein
VGLAGIEPATSALSVLRSNRLSYSPAASAGSIARHIQQVSPFSGHRTEHNGLFVSE